MALMGIYALDFGESPRSFFIFWTVFFILLLSVLALAVFDAFSTMFNFLKERERLRKDFRRELQESKDTQP